MKLLKIETGNFMADGGAIFGVIPKKMWGKAYPSDEDNYCNLTMRCLLVDTGDRRILIDTGTGNKQSEKFFSYSRLNGDASLASSFEETGYSFDDITDVILTHLHWDHCGGCVYYDEEGNEQVTFPNATHWVAKGQWDNYVAPNMREAAVYFPENMMPVYNAGLLKTVEKDGEIIPGVEVRIYNGHTTGNMVPIVNAPSGKIAFMGDLIPVVASIRLPWVSAYDVQPILSIDEKEAFLQEAVDKDITLFFEHDLYTECCRVQMTEKGILAKELFSLEQLVKQEV